MPAHSRRDLQHFAHAGTALGTFIANDEDIAGFHLVGLHGGEAVFFAVEDTCGAAMLNAIGRGDLHHAAFGSEVALEDDEAAGRLDGLIEGVNHDLARSFLGERGFFGESFAADGESGSVGVASVDQALGQHSASRPQPGSARPCICRPAPGRR